MNLRLDFCAFLLTCTVLFTSVAIAANTHIQTDGTLSGITELNINTPGASHLYTLSEINGKLSGHNLFYSFSNFSIGTTDTAWFNLNTADLTNVINRVTGGTESLIDGQLKMTNVGNAPSFFFINPAGITFNSGASVDVPGSFYVSTASHLRFSDGIQYAANETAASSLSSANLESFGFLGNEAGSLNLSGTETARTNINFKPASEVAFIANQITIDNADIINANSTQAGLDLHLITTGMDAASIKLDTFSGQSTAGELIVRNAIVDVSGNGSARLAIHSDNFMARNSNLFADNTGVIPMTDEHGIDVFVRSGLIADNSVISSDALSQGSAGTVTVHAERFEIDGQGSNFLTGISSDANGGTGNAGQVTMTVTDMLTLLGGGEIRSITNTQGNAGTVTIHAGRLEIDGQGSNLLTGISSDVNGGTGNAGQVTVTVTDMLRLLGGGEIRSNTGTRGNAGAVTVNAGQLEIDGKGDIFTGIHSDANGGTGNAGQVTVTVIDMLRLLGGGAISSDTQYINTQGDAGAVTVKAGQLEIDGKGEGKFFTGIHSDTGFSSTGDAGHVTVIVTDMLRLLSTGQITSGTNTQGDAGTVTVNAGQLEIDGKGILYPTGINTDTGFSSTGDAGQVTVTVTGMLRLLGTGGISSLTVADGKAGTVTVNAGQLEIDGQGQVFAGIFSDARNGAGDAGQVMVTVTDTLRLLDGGQINSNTNTQGKAGAVTVDAEKLIIDNAIISSSAEIDSSGQTGSIEIIARNEIRLSDNAQISIKNDAIVTEGRLDSLTPTTIKIDTTSLFLTNSRIAADSNGNVDAGNINIHFADQLFLDPSQISTEAASGNGGDIRIQGNGAIFLLDSAITTSVSGQSGNGGDIAIAAKGLILDSGFIQANTAASGASGGKVDIQTPALIPNGSSLFVGGNIPLQFQPFSGLNVIQAAAPDGVSGTINAVAPQLNLNAMMTNLMIESFDSSALNRDMCSISDSSSLMQSGRGAQPLRARDLLLSPMF